MSQKRDYYEILSVTRQADGVEVKRAYRKLAVELHPDRNPGNPEAEERFKEASEAYQVLSDPEKRQLYDRFGHEGPRSAGAAGFSNVGDIFSQFSDIFGDMFGGAFGGPGRGPARGADIETAVDIGLAESATGVAREINVRRHVSCTSCKGSGAAPGTGRERCPQCRGRGQVVHSQGFLMISTTCPGCQGAGEVVKSPCSNCRGSGMEVAEERLTVNVPAGVEDGSTLRLQGRGEAAPASGRSGNLYVHIRVKPDPRFERDGADLHTEVAVSFPQAALGATAKIPTLEGEMEIDIPAGTQPGEVLLVRGQGMPRLQERGNGNLHVHVKLVVPKKLTPQQEESLRSFAAAGGDEVDPSRGGIFGRRKKR